MSLTASPRSLNERVTATRSVTGTSLRFLLVHDWLPSLGGSENVFQEICSLYPGPVVSPLVKHELFPWLDRREVWSSVFQKIPYLLRRHYVISPFMPSFFRNVDTSKFDVLLVDSHSFAHHIFATEGTPYLCYYHTSARSLWNPEIDGRACGGRLGLVKRWLADSLRKLDLAASRQPTYRIANSQTIADRIHANYGQTVDEIIYPPVEVEKWTDTSRVDDSEGFLMWGRLIGYKRIDLAIEAAKITGFKLNIVGTGPLEAKLKKVAADAPNIRFHGRLADHALKTLLARTTAVLFPGYEDFGIVPVEAMAAGVPVIAYGKGGAAETVSGHGLLLHAQSAAELAERMSQIQSMFFDPELLKNHARNYDVSIFRAKYQEAVSRAIAKSHGQDGSTFDEGLQDKESIGGPLR